MYCSGCGTQIQSGLNYCSRCGRRVAEDLKDGGLNATPSVVAAITAGAGFLGFVLVVRILSKAGMPGNQIIPIAFFYCAALFGICSMILRQTQLSSKKDRQTERNDLPVENESAAYLRPVTTAQLGMASEIPASVTEHTTRTLDEVKVERH